MKSAATFLEDYSTSFAPLAFADQEDLGPQGYEAGYSAGWEDATKAQSEVADTLRLDLAQRLQDLAFTFHEARAHILAGIEPVLTQIATLAVPAVLQETLGLHLVQQLRQAVSDHIPSSLTLRISPTDRDKIEASLPKDLVAPLEIIENEDLPPGLFEFSFDGQSTQVDFSQLQAAVREAVLGYLSQTTGKDVSHG